LEKQEILHALNRDEKLEEVSVIKMNEEEPSLEELAVNRRAKMRLPITPSLPAKRTKVDIPFSRIDVAQPSVSAYQSHISSITGLQEVRYSFKSKDHFILSHTLRMLL
jgi:hypothetical protein